MRRALIVVSNRGPVSYGRDGEGKRVAERGGGGLVTALRGLMAHHDVTWIASAISDEDRVVAAESAGMAIEETARDGSPYRLRLVDHGPAVYDRFYNVVANPMLWFIQHSLWDLGRTPDVVRGLHDAWNNGYVPANESFASAVVAELERVPGRAVCFHDYHLYLAPRLVRNWMPDARLAHFVHVPWPASDSWTVLPAPFRRAVHDGLLANDVVSFHTRRWRRNFLRSCEDLTEAEIDWDAHTLAARGRRTLTTAHPISVDPAEFDEVARSEAVLEEERLLLATRPEYLVVRVDRVDPSKNVVRGFRAFGLFLDEHPELHGRVQLLALLDPSRQGIPEYSEYLAAIQREGRAVNDRFGADGWVPVRVEIADNFPQSVAAYKQYDVLLVNAVFDGLNLVAKEAPLVNTRNGVLLLSENAGVHEEIGAWALTINPFDICGQAEAIGEAIGMGEEDRRARAEAIRAHVRAHPVAAWIDAQLADLDSVGTTIGR